MRILIVDDDPERARVLRAGLEGADHVIVGQVGPGDDLRAALAATRAEMVLASMTSPDRDALESFRRASDGLPGPIVMFVDEEGAGMAAEAVRAGVSAYIVDGLSPKRVRPVLDVAIARYREFRRLQDALARSETALAERKVIDRAKGILMRQRGLAEDEAYALLRKTAMAQSQKMVEVARSVIQVAEMLEG